MQPAVIVLITLIDDIAHSSLVAGRSLTTTPSKSRATPQSTASPERAEIWSFVWDKFHESSTASARPVVVRSESVTSASVSFLQDVIDKLVHEDNVMLCIAARRIVHLSDSDAESSEAQGVDR